MNEINKIEKIRSKNNRSWMDLLRLSVKENPKKAKKILIDIVKRDTKVTEQLKKLLTRI